MIYPINYIKNNNYQNTLLKNKQKTPCSHSSQGKSQPADYHMAYTTFVKQNISFTSKPVVKQVNPSCTLTLTDEPCSPQIHINIVANKNLPIKQGVFLLNSMVVNDQICEQNQQLEQVMTSHFSCTPYSKSFNYVGSQNVLLDSLKMIDDCFFSNKLSQKHLDNAKKLAPVVLFLNKRTNEFNDELFDIPRNMTEKQYENLIDSITLQDLIDYNNDILKNSKKEVNIRLNKEFYNKNSEILLNYCNIWDGFYENK